MLMRQLIVSLWCGMTAMAGVALADEPTTPVDDLTIAKAALRSLGADIDGTTNRCAGCHTINLYFLNDLREQTYQAQWTCFDRDNNDDPTAPMDRINCMRENPADATSRFKPSRLGVYTAGAHLPRFADMFKAAYPEADWQQQYDVFKHAVQMPVGGEHQMPEAEFDQVLQWTSSGMPHMEQLVANVPEAPRTCTESFSPELRDHVRRMQLEGWEAKNKENGIMMFACDAGGDKYACFNQRYAEGGAIFPEAAATVFGTTWNRDFPEAKLRVLRILPYDTSYWMRSSADGRFVANGAYDSEGSDDGDDGDDGSDGEYFGGRVADLQNQLIPGSGMRDIRVAASYDPSFFPDNSGFMFQGTPVGSGFCKQSILSDLTTTHIRFDEPVCSGSSDINLYQAVGGSLDGADYLAVTGSFESDSGSGNSNGDNQPSWLERSYAWFTPIVNDGERFVTRPRSQLFTPFEGDWQVSPSNMILSSRVSGLGPDGAPRQQGYRFHMLTKRVTPTGYAFDVADGGTLCMKGGKTSFSYNDRMFTTYHYVDQDDWQELGYASAQDPEFQNLVSTGSANVYVVDLLTGTRRRITRLGAGQFAMFPHYRSDGWLYFMVYDRTRNERFVVASDASLRLADAVDAIVTH